ncbi:hypothetical protein SCP_0902760 [Sparassis crispa]|uniref:Uncharacterized protein n=1 Tax=Sparassis crispa TaxID=139825 RepID=A0A401GVZ6_9APHY|nr:hypothetical protein SCP_0902760 [Sparassis crispa]GBE86397.1 hypothetical protein SCP_0902760 [Sparassis crispa]
MRGAAPPPHMLPTQKMSAPFVAYGLCARVHPPYLSPSLSAVSVCVPYRPLPSPLPLSPLLPLLTRVRTVALRFIPARRPVRPTDILVTCRAAVCVLSPSSLFRSRTVPTDVDTYLVPLRNYTVHGMCVFVVLVHPALELAPSIAKIYCTALAVLVVPSSRTHTFSRILSLAYYVPVPSSALRCSLSLAICIVSLRPCLKLLTI